MSPSAHFLRAAALALALGLFLARAETNVSILLGRGDSLVGWTTAWNTPSPGNSLALSAAPTPWSSLPFFNVSFNFISGATGDEFLTPTAAAAPALLGGVPGALGLSFAGFNPSATARLGLLATVTDAAGKAHGTGVELAPGGWKNYSIAFSSAAWWPAGAAWALPLATFTLGPARSPPFASDAGWFGLADIALVASPPAPGAVGAPVSWDLVQPAPATGGVLAAGDAPAAVGAFIANRLPTPCAVDARVERRNATGPMGEGAGGGFDASWEACGAVNGTLAPWATMLLACTVDASRSPPGYVVMRAVLASAACWGANESARGQVVFEGAVAIAMPQPGAAARVATAAARARERDASPARVANVFGGQMLLPDAPGAAAAAALGMLNVRTTGAVWAFTQRADCWAENATCLNFAKADAALAALAAQGVELTLCVMEAAPAWAADRNGTAFWPAQDHYADFARFAGLLLDRYGAGATALECMNEVDGLAYLFVLSQPARPARAKRGP